MLRLSFLTGFLVLSVGFEICVAQPVDQGYVLAQKISESLRTLDEYYRDVKVNVNCKRDRYAVAKIVCRDKYLYDLATLNSKSRAFSIENATHSKINHKRSYGRIPPATCLTKKCIYEFYKSEINASMGDVSPFADQGEDATKPTP
jgi:hypothetical protein